MEAIIIMFRSLQKEEADDGKGRSNKKKGRNKKKGYKKKTGKKMLESNAPQRRGEHCSEVEGSAKTSTSGT
jgi:hypothetical protein